MSGATSVTGKGKGAAYNNKGPHNGRNLYVPLVGPHIVAAGSATTAAGTATVTFPEALELAADKYVVILTPQAATTTVAKVTTKTDSSSKFASFVITGDTAIAYDWIVVKKGYNV